MAPVAALTLVTAFDVPAWPRGDHLPDWWLFCDQRPVLTYKQRGNGVNIGAVWHVLREHVAGDEDVLKRTKVGRGNTRGRVVGTVVAGRILETMAPTGD